MRLKELKDKLSGTSLNERLSLISSEFREKIVFTTSFGLEDQVISHLIFTGQLPVKVVTIDTGRLFPKTYELFSVTLIKYRKKIEVFFPESTGVEKMVSEKGPFSFYNSQADRKECCNIRKVEPLNRAMTGMECWISGIRADQSDSRSGLDWLEYDEHRKIYKYYPLFDWSWDDVISFADKNHIPYNQLHKEGFVSIGCEPCTRAIKPGESFRAGRWWWENDGPKECGLHVK